MIDKIKTCVQILSLEPLEFKVCKLIDSDDTFQDIQNKVLPKLEYTPVKGDKIYFIPGCDVPRFKVKQYCEKYGVAIVKYREKANVKFIGPNSISELIVSTSWGWYDKTEILKWLALRPIPMVWESLTKAIQESDYGGVILFPYSVQTKLANQGCKLNAFDRISFMFKDDKSYDTFLSILDDPELYSQNEILSKINTGKLMTQENYESIKRLFQSTDKENLKLAMETMANCDYQTSCVPLLLLINEFGKEIYNSSTKHHINFKSLLKFFDIDNLTNFDIDDIISSLLKKKLLNKSNLDLLMPIAIKNMTKNAGVDHLTVKEVIVSSEIEKGIEENILDENSNTEIVNDEEELNIKM